MAYSASKGAVSSMTFSIAAALGEHGIRVNAILPGQINTEMLRREGRGGSDISISLGRRGEPAEAGDAVALLVSDMARYVHSATLLVDGGFSNTF